MTDFEDCNTPSTEPPVFYVVTRTQVRHPETGALISTYGILPHGYPQYAVPDISTSLAFVSALAQRCTTCGLSPIHLHDVVEDALTEVWP